MASVEPVHRSQLRVAGSKVDTYLSFKNTQDNGMGIPMPSGRVRVSKLDVADSSPCLSVKIVSHAKNEAILSSWALLSTW
jgi:hypothetical protein